MEALRNNPRIAELQQAVRQNPALLQVLIQQLAATNPQLAEHLSQNPDALLQMLGGQPGEGGFEGEEGGEGGVVPQILHVTQEERAAIERVSVVLLF